MGWFRKVILQQPYGNMTRWWWRVKSIKKMTANDSKSYLGYSNKLVD